jgi:hypothetical protein
VVAVTLTVIMTTVLQKQQQIPSTT